MQGLEAGNIYTILATFLVFVGTFLVLYKEYFSPAKTFIITVVVLFCFGIIDKKEVISGFANDQILLMMLLLVIGGTINKSEFLEHVFQRMIGNAKTYNSFMIRMTSGVAAFSGFVNNTPLVAIMMPYVIRWAKQNKISPSKVLIPLSFAALVGGTITLVGTSTNLFVNGLTKESGLEPFKLFDYAFVGIPLSIMSVIYLVFFSKRLLPSHKDPIDMFNKSSRDFVVEARVESGSPLVGKTVEEAHLRHLKGLFLVEVIRNNKAIAAVGPDFILLDKDILLFAGDVNTITELLNDLPGLSLPKAPHNFKLEKNMLCEVIVSPSSSLVGQTVKNCNFRSNYDASVVAIHRHGEPISGKIGEIELQKSDVLLILSGGNFEERNAESKNFYILSISEHLSKLNWKYSLLAVGGMMLALILSSFNILSLFEGLLILCGLLLATSTISLKEFKNMLDFDLFVISALAVAFGSALTNSGLADLTATWIVKLLGQYGVIGILISVYLIAMIFTEFLNNIAAAAMAFPIALASANQLGVDPHPFIITIAIAASSNFITPIGYQTNLMVMGPGSYSFKDFARIGFPLAILYGAITIITVGWYYDLF